MKETLVLAGDSSAVAEPRPPAPAPPHFHTPLAGGARPAGVLAASLAAGGSSALPHFFGRHFLLVCCDIPDVSKGVRHAADPVAVKLILHRLLHLGPSRDSLVEQCVHVLDVEEDAHLRGAERLWAAVTHFRELVRKHEGRIADPDPAV